MNRSTAILMAALACFSLSCGGPSITACSKRADCGADSVCSEGRCQQNANGNLQLVFAGLPNDVSGSVVITGPAGFNKTVTGSQTLVDVPPGSYNIVAKEVNSGDYSYGATPASVTVNVAPLGATTIGAFEYTVRTGALKLAITGVPANGTILLTGPGDFSQTIPTPASQVVPRLVAGTYSVGRIARISGSIVDQLFDGAGTTATVATGVTASAAASYVSRNGTGKLWVALAGSAAGYDGAQLLASGSPAPSVSVAIPSMLPEGVALDGEGNLWISSFDSLLRKYPPNQLTTSGVPTVTIEGTSLAGPIGLAFDSGQNLWVANFFNRSIVKFTPAQLVASGSPVASVTISAVGPSILEATGIAFDSNQNMWVANSSAPSSIVEFTPGQLSTSGAPVPAVTISSAALDRPFQLAFDTAGSLWVANIGGSILKFTTAQLAASGAPAPAVVITGPALNEPAGLAFDTGGNLWVMNSGLESIVKYNAAQLAATGAPTPVTVVSGVAAGDAVGIAFNPAPIKSTILH